MITAIWGFTKYLGILLICAVCYYVYEFVIKMYLIRKRYSKYRNVYVSPTFVPLLGDAAEGLKDQKEGKARHYFQIKRALKNEGHDMNLFTAGSFTFISVNSEKAIKEFLEKIPGHFDRKTMKDEGFGKLVPESMVFNKSTKSWKKRRDGILKHLGINFASKYISTMIDAWEENFTKLEKGNKYDAVLLFNRIAFKVITVMLFGNDVNEKIGTIDFLQPDGSIVALSFSEYFIRLSKDLAATFIHWANLLIPFLSNNDLIEPFKTNAKNIRTLYRVLQEFLDKSEDKESVFHKVVHEEGLSKDEVFPDLMGFLLAGHDTSAHAAVSAIYFLRKYPDTENKLREELETITDKSYDEIRKTFTKEKIYEMEYLNQVLKETLRVDNPAASTLLYEAVKNTSLCGVQIPKGEIVIMNVCARHYDPKQWYDPVKFIPERFDPESEYYSKPNSGGKMRDSYAWFSFSNGLRNCPGRTLALLETRVFIACFLAKVNYKIPKETLEKEGAYFCIDGQLTYEFEVV